MTIGSRSSDGRNFGRQGALTGEAAGMRVEAPDQAWPLASTRREIAVIQSPAAEAETATYYDLPVVKPPPWKWYIPAYLYAGGAAGAAAALATAAQLSGRPELARLVRKTRWIALVGSATSAGLLIADLGRPERFLNMLRVFRPTSPMNLGTWILSAAGAASGLALLGELRDRSGRASVAGVLSGISGLGLTTYTAVLLSNTAVPLWCGSHRRMPLLFGASAAASAASLLELSGHRTRAERTAVRRFGAVAKAGELVAMHAVQRGLRGSRAGRPLTRGRSGGLWRGALALGAASLVATLLPGGGRRRERLAGALGTAGAVAMRFAIIEAGKASARDPRATFEPQRQRTRLPELEPRSAAPVHRAPQPGAASPW